NAILIVEFAKDLYEEGEDLFTATMTAARLRYRPILMTSFAFILGVTPLAMASGAGSASQNAIGIGVMGGMIAATTLAIFFVPMFYISVQKLTKTRSDDFSVESVDALETGEPAPALVANSDEVH